MTNFPYPPFSVTRPRIGIIRWNIPVTVNHSIRGILADLGPEGISIVTESSIRVGTRVSVEFEILGQHLRGDFDVQFMRIVPTGHIRSRLRLVQSDFHSMGLRLEQLTLLLEHQYQDKPYRAA